MVSKRKNGNFHIFRYCSRSNKVPGQCVHTASSIWLISHILPPPGLPHTSMPGYSEAMKREPGKDMFHFMLFCTRPRYFLPSCYPVSHSHGLCRILLSLHHTSFLGFFHGVKASRVGVRNCRPPSQKAFRSVCQALDSFRHFLHYR